MEAGFTTDKSSPLERRIAAVLKVCHHSAGWCFVVIVVMTTVHIIGRYGFNMPVPGLIELTSYLVVTAVFLQGAYTLAMKGHVTIGLIVDRFSARTQAIIDSATYLLCLAFAIVALWQTMTRAATIIERGLTSTILHIPASPFIIIIGIGWGLFAIAIGMHLVHFIATVVKK